VEQRANGSIWIHCLTCTSPLGVRYLFLLSRYGSCRPYKPLLRDNAANDTYIPAPIYAFALLHLAPTSAGVLNGTVSPVHNLFPYVLKLIAPDCDRVIFPEWSNGPVPE
jgi:hypothetical protein